MQEKVSNELEQAIAERDKYLKENPKMQKYQDEIDELLDKVPQEKRLEVLTDLTLGKLVEIQHKLVDLCGVLNDTITM